MTELGSFHRQGGSEATCKVSGSMGNLRAALILIGRTPERSAVQACVANADLRESYHRFKLSSRFFFISPAWKDEAHSTETADWVMSGKRCDPACLRKSGAEQSEGVVERKTGRSYPYLSVEACWGTVSFLCRLTTRPSQSAIEHPQNTKHCHSP